MKKLYANIDINSVTFPFLEKLTEQEKITPDMLYPFIDVNRLTGVTDILLNVYCMFSSVKSDCLPDYVDIMENEDNWGDRAIIFKEWRGLYEIQQKHGIDVYGTWIDRCRQIGLNPWISINLRETRKGKTTILIAHRVSTVEKMDKIIFVDDGKILAVGSHDELLANSSEYRKTVELQKLDEEEV